MTIQVVGSGCPTCKRLYQLTQQAVAEMNLSVTVEYISGSAGTLKIIQLGAMSSPLLVINGQIALTGFTPHVVTIKQTISQYV